MSRKVNVPVTVQAAEENVEALLEALAGLRTLGRSVTVSEKSVAQAALHLFTPIYEELLKILKTGAPPQKKVASSLLYAHAYFYGMAGKCPQGERFIDEAHRLAKGGVWAEHCQDYYRNIV